MGDARTLLVANRGEIAVRVFATCRRLGIRTTAVAGPGDEGALHTRVADVALPVTSYLDVEALVAAARGGRRRARAPWLRVPRRERRSSQTRSSAAGLTWVGPPPDVLRLGGDKLEAKRIAAAGGIYDTPSGRSRRPRLSVALQGDRRRRRTRDAGSARVRRTSTMRSRQPHGRRRRRSADPTVSCERYLAHPDTSRSRCSATSTAPCSHLDERDCSVQRRHQKVIEESPPPGFRPISRTHARHEVGFGAEWLRARRDLRVSPRRR